MTNFEYYKDDIQAVGYDFGVTIENEIIHCEFENCARCKFDYHHSYNDACMNELIRWLYAEHIEQPKLTKDEYNILKLMYEDFYLARDKDGDLVVYSKKPHKKYEFDMWEVEEEHGYIILTKNVFKTISFSFITWDDDEPWLISDLLKLEVAE